MHFLDAIIVKSKSNLIVSRLIRDGKMNIVYLVGNGFDISFGLKTSPCDFLNSFIESYPDEKEKFFHGAGLNVEEINLIKDKVFIVKSGDIFRLCDS